MVLLLETTTTILEVHLFFVKCSIYEHFLLKYKMSDKFKEISFKISIDYSFQWLKYRVM